MAKEKTKKTKKEDEVKKPTEEELIKIIVELSKQGLTSEKIGLVLKDKHKILAKKMLGKKINQILKEHGVGQDADMINLSKKVERFNKHLQIHKRDYKTRIALLKREAKIRKYKKYSKKE